MLKKIIEFVIEPQFLLIVSVIFLIAGHFVFKKTYLDCRKIVLKHMECFKTTKGIYSKVSIFIYFFVPCLISIALIQIRTIDDNVINIITIIVSILTSMLFTLLTLILDMRKKVLSDREYDGNKANISWKILKETYYTIMFEILVSVIILIMCFVEIFSKEYSLFSSAVIYYLTFVLLVNLFIVLKRIFKVIDEDIKVQDEQL